MEWSGSLVDDEQLALDVGHAEADVTHREIVQVRVSPAEGDLQDVVQRVEGSRGRHDQPTPNSRSDVTELNKQTHVAVGEGQLAEHNDRLRQRRSSIIDHRSAGTRTNLEVDPPNDGAGRFDLAAAVRLLGVAVRRGAQRTGCGR